MGQEIEGEVMGDKFKGFVFRITGGNDKQGFQMKQGILINGRTRILYKKRGTGYKPSRVGERKRKSVRGCILGSDLAAIFLSIVKKGDNELEGVTDDHRPSRLGKKRRNNIIKCFGLDKKKDDVRKYIVTREIKRADKTFYKSPKIQRLITETRIRRKHMIKKETVDRNKNTREAVKKYEAVLSQYAKQKKAQKETAAKAVEAKK